jgi:hypothetical protein
VPDADRSNLDRGPSPFHQARGVRFQAAAQGTMMVVGSAQLCDLIFREMANRGVQMKRLCTIILVQATALLFACEAVSQMKVDVPADTIRRLANKTYLEDLSVNDTAHFYQPTCVENDGLFIPGWTQPYDLANSDYKQTGLMLRIQVVPGKKVKGTLVDAAQAQAIAKGHPNEPASLIGSAYNEAVISYVNGLYSGGFFGNASCEDERRSNPLRTLNLFGLESINGFKKISDLIASVTAKAR